VAISGVKIKFDRQAVTARISGQKDAALGQVTNEFIKDANYYARQDSSELIKSSLKHSDPNKGIARWRTPYAKRMYYVGTPVKDKNPNASLMWAHKAAAQNKEKYRKMFSQLMGGKQNV
jgi:hypothetical protein